MQGHAGLSSALALVLAGLIAGCAELPPASTGEARPVAKAELPASPPPEAPLLQVHPVLAMPALQAYVEDVGRRLAQLSGHRADWRFAVVDHAGYGAWALPDGHVYLARGLIAKLNSEAELAAVLAREIAHVAGGHVPLERESTGLPGLLGPRPDFGLDAPARYRPEDQRAADARAARMLIEAGYEPRALLAVLGRNDEVRKRVVELARRDGGPEYRIARDEYLNQLDGLPWGPEPALGWLDGTLLRHNVYGLAVELPKGWPVLRRPGRIVAGEPAGDGLVELAPLSAGDDPMAALKALLPFDQGGRFDSGELNDRPAAFAAGSVDGHPLLASVVRYDKGLFAMVAQSRDAETYRRDRTLLRAALNSLRPLGADEPVPTHLLKLTVVRLDAATTLADLATKTPLGPAALPVLRMLNSLPAKAELPAGQRVKTLE